MHALRRSGVHSSACTPRCAFGLHMLERDTLVGDACAVGHGMHPSGVRALLSAYSVAPRGVLLGTCS